MDEKAIAFDLVTIARFCLLIIQSIKARERGCREEERGRRGRKEEGGRITNIIVVFFYCFRKDYEENLDPLLKVVYNFSRPKNMYRLIAGLNVEKFPVLEEVKYVKVGEGRGERAREGGWGGV